MSKVPKAKNEVYPYTKCGGRYKIPVGVKKAAEKGLLMHKRGYKGGTQTGWDRARQLIRCEYVTAKTIQTMKAWFARHIHTSYPGYLKWKEAGSPTSENYKYKGSHKPAISWLLWGSDAGKRWLDRIKL